jgi:hypothetical protein
MENNNRVLFGTLFSGLLMMQYAVKPNKTTSGMRTPGNRNALVLLTAILLTACGGGGGGTPAAGTLGGVAAVGTPIVNGNISVVCTAGSALATTTNATTGAWSVTLSGQTLPCAVEVSNGTINGVSNTTRYHSIATAAGTVNVTPLTDLMVANLAGSASPGIWFAGLSTTPTTLNTITPAQVNASLVKLSAALSALSPLGSNNPITTAFTPVAGNVSDDMLSALATAIAANTGVTYSSLLSNASISAFTVPVTGFGTALMAAYVGTTSGAPIGGSSGGAAQLTFNAIPANGIFTSAANNVAVDFVDIVGATVTVNSTDIIVDITLRNLPATFTFNQANVPLNYLEYEWGVDFDTNNDNVADYSLSLSRYKYLDNPASLTSTPAAGPLVNGTNSHISPQVNVWKNNNYLVAATASVSGNTLRLSVPKSANVDLANITASARVRVMSFYRSDSTTTVSDSI